MAIQLSPPWITFYKKVNELFKQDEEVKVAYDDAGKTLSLKVKKYEKAEALKKLLPKEKTFGHVTIKIEVNYIPDNAEKIDDLYKEAFADNPAFKYTFTFNTGTNTITYVVFEKEVVQFWNDDMSDPHGVTSTLYEEIARDLFGGRDGVIFSTDSEKNNNWPARAGIPQATPEEIAEWEKYNGKGSYKNGKSPENKDKPVEVKDEEPFKSILNCKNYKYANRKDLEWVYKVYKDEDMPF